MSEEESVRREQSSVASESSVKSNEETLVFMDDEKSCVSSQGDEESCLARQCDVQFSQPQCQCHDACVCECERSMNPENQSDGTESNGELELSPATEATSLAVPGEDISWQNYLVYVMLVYCFLFIRYEI